jgi:hypothetical protein
MLRYDATTPRPAGQPLGRIDILGVNHGYGVGYGPGRQRLEGGDADSGDDMQGTRQLVMSANQALAEFADGRGARAVVASTRAAEDAAAAVAAAALAATAAALVCGPPPPAVLDASGSRVWTPTEDAIVLAQLAHRGTKWTQISKFLFDRSGVDVYNRYHRHLSPSAAAHRAQAAARERDRRARIAHASHT